MLDQDPVERMCSSKTRFPLRDALQRAEALGMRAYHCPHCDGHHLTAASRWTRKERAVRKKAQQRIRRSRRDRG